jgi:hypothetical protein
MPHLFSSRLGRRATQLAATFQRGATAAPTGVTHMSDEIDLKGIEGDYQAVPRPENAEPPDGKYNVVIQKVELTRARSSGNPMLRWHLRITAGPHAGRVLFRSNMMATRENLAWLKKDLHTCGMELEKLSDLNTRMGELLDVEIEVTRRTRDDRVNVFINKRLESTVIPDTLGGGDDIPF